MPKTSCKRVATNGLRFASGLSNKPSAVSSNSNSVPGDQARAARKAAGKTTWPLLESLMVFTML